MQGCVIDEFAVIDCTRLMSAITIRNIDDGLKRRLRLRAAQHNRSMEEEARDILRCALSEEPRHPDNLADAIRQLVEPYGGFELPAFPRGPLRDPPDFL
jgi:antitoxin FitA